MKNTCSVCNKHNFGIIDKIPLLIGLSIKCKQCKTSYLADKIHVFEDGFIFVSFFLKLFSFISELLFLPIIILTVYVFTLRPQYAMIISIIFLLAIIIYLRLITVSVDVNDPKNTIIDRIEKRKQH